MARHDYDRHAYGHNRGYHMDAGWGWDEDGGDPNWRGGTYHGMRMNPGPHQGAYGRYRMYREYDLGGHGGFDGRADLPNGWFDERGYYHEAYERGGPPEPRRMHPRGYEHDEGVWRMEDGGVRYDSEYLRQYNSRSPALGPGGPHRSWGFSEGPDAPPMRHLDSRGRPTDERGYAGYNQGGFAEGKFRGPGTRQANPNR